MFNIRFQPLSEEWPLPSLNGRRLCREKGTSRSVWLDTEASILVATFAPIIRHSAFVIYV